jgi:hypothetical protein
MKSIVFDTSSVISIMTNNLMDTLIKLKQDSGVNYVITDEIKRELLDVPLQGKKYKLEAIMLSHYLNKYFKTFSNLNFESMTNYILEKCNTLFSINGKALKLVDKAEVEGLVVAMISNADAYVVDERTMRLIVENPRRLHKLLEKKFHSKIEVDYKILREFETKFENIEILRSSELMVTAYYKNLFVKYNYDEQILEALLWGLRLRGCSISREDIDAVMKLKR